MAKRKDGNHELERYSRGRLRMTLAEWVVNSLDEDYAFDFEVRPTEGFGEGDPDQHGDAVLPSPFYVQLKASHGFENPESVYHRFDVEYLVEDCLQASIPVVLVICDREAEELYWCVLQTHCWDVLDDENEGWREQETVQIRFDRNPLADSIRLLQLRSAIRDAEHRISTRQYVASARRGTLYPSKQMRVASADEVTEYKTNVVDDALELARAGRLERAQSKLMEVYQMAEEDDPTVDALEHLLELRATDDPSIALTKVTLAEDGIRLSIDNGDEEVTKRLQEHLTDAIEYLDELLIGAQYQSPNGLPIRVLDLQRAGGTKAILAGTTALVQFGSDLTDIHADTLTQNDAYELRESGKSHSPQDEACAEGEHRFDQEMLRDAPTAATCTTCGFSCEVLEQWFTQETPRVCDNCGEKSYDTEYQLDSSRTREQCLCSACR